MKIMIDGEEVAEIEYEAGILESLELVISPEFYTDSIISVNFECDDGDFAAVGPVYIYRYESETVGGKTGTSNGPMAQKSSSSNSGSINIFPNPFKDKIRINFANLNSSVLKITICDVSGRVVKKLYEGEVSHNISVDWNGTDQNEGIVPQGIYFLRIESDDIGKSLIHKVILIR